MRSAYALVTQSRELMSIIRATQMNKDSMEGAARRTVGQAEELGGRAFKDRQTTAQGRYDQAVGGLESTMGQAKDAMASGASSVAKAVGGAADEVANVDFSALRDDLAKLSRTLGQLVQSQAASTTSQVMDMVGAAGDNISQSAAVAQDKMGSIEADLESRIQRNPWSAVAIALGVGVLIGKIS